MSTEQEKIHHIGEWAHLRNTSPEIAHAIFELADYDEVLAEKSGKKVAMKCFHWHLPKPIKSACFGENRLSNERMSDIDRIIAEIFPSHLKLSGHD